MTPKEALEAIRKELQDRLDFPINLTPEYRLVSQALTELEAPTSEEVCKALSDELGGKVTYDSGEFELVYDDFTGYTQTICYRENNGLRIALIMKPSTIKLLASFYENEVKE